MRVFFRLLLLGFSYRISLHSVFCVFVVVCLFVCCFLFINFHLRYYCLVNFIHSFFFSECQNYQILNNPERKETYGGGAVSDRIGPGWFRYQGAAGTRMTTTCPPTYRCNGDAPGWLNGGHPTVAEGRVTRQVCFNWDGNNCWHTFNIEVRNCGAFYVYYLSYPGCDWCNYCGTD